MPIIKSAIKQMRQSEKHRQRNQHYKSQMKSLIKLVLDYVKAGETAKAEKMLSKALSSVDTCAKKNIIHKKNAAHKKSRVQKAFHALSKKPAEKSEKKA